MGAAIIAIKTIGNRKQAGGGIGNGKCLLPGQNTILKLVLAMGLHGSFAQDFFGLRVEQFFSCRLRVGKAQESVVETVNLCSANLLQEHRNQAG